MKNITRNTQAIKRKHTGSLCFSLLMSINRIWEVRGGQKQEFSLDSLRQQELPPATGMLRARLGAHQTLAKIAPLHRYAVPPPVLTQKRPLGHVSAKKNHVLGDLSWVYSQGFLSTAVRMLV